MYFGSEEEGAGSGVGTGVGFGCGLFGSQDSSKQIDVLTMMDYVSGYMPLIPSHNQRRPLVSSWGLTSFPSLEEPMQHTQICRGARCPEFFHTVVCMVCTNQDLFEVLD